MSGGDGYYNNGEYLGWQYYGASMGHPFLIGPQYNRDHRNAVEGSRVKAQHVGLEGDPSEEWNWRLLLSYTRNWGTYQQPFDKVEKQFSGMAEVTYRPGFVRGWSVSAALGLDRGGYPGNSTGAMVTIRKTGGWKL